MTLEGTIAGLRYRRSRRSDAAPLARMMELGDAIGGGLPTPGVFRVFTERDFALLIETAMICVTAVRDVPSSEAAATATDKTEEVVAGFISLDDVPPNHSISGGAGQNSGDSNTQESVRAQMAAYIPIKKQEGPVTQANSLWLRMLLSPESAFLNSSTNCAPTGLSATGSKTLSGKTALSYSTPEITMDLLRVTLGSLSGVEHVFLSLGGPFACLSEIPGLSKLPSTVASSSTSSTTASVFHLGRAAVLPPLTMRQGRVEDYDDAVTLLVAGGPGIITRLPPQFYLEELLQAQDAQHKVIVAEDSVTHEVVGLACVRQLNLEEQQYLARFYNTDMLERLKPMNVDGSETAAAPAAPYHDSRAPSCTASIFFLYFNPHFEHSAYQLLPYIFLQFPLCDYAALQCTHAQRLPEPMVLQRFQYMPLRRYQPHNVRGEVTPPPDALWVCPRVSLEAEAGMQAQVAPLFGPAGAELWAAVMAQFGAPHAAPAAGSGVHAVLHQQQQKQQLRRNSTSTTAGGAGSILPGCSMELLSALREDLGIEASHEKTRQAAGPVPIGAVFALSWGLPAASSSPSSTAGRTVVGVLSVQPLSVGEMYALRANYDLDRFLSFNTAGSYDYTATDIFISAGEGPLRYRSAELPGLAVRFAYIRPAFRHHLKFFLREVLRQTRTEVLLNLTSVDASLCQTALLAFTYAPPRRVVEVEGTTTASKTITNNYAGGIDEDGDSEKSTIRIPEVNDVTPALARDKTASNAAAAAAGKEKEKDDERGNAANLALSSLFFTTRRLLSDERVRVHPRLVVVGASATALSMLYELFRVPYVELLNVTLIATDGIPPHPNQTIGDSVIARSRQQQIWQADTMGLLEREYMRLRLGDGINTTASLSIGANVVRVVQGTLIDIDTNLKYVQLENGVYEPYDHLILATGRQYIVPPAIRALQQQEARSTLDGVMALSGVLAEDKLRHALSELNQSNATSIANVVVYGSGLDAIATLSTMISVGFPAQRLVLCRPQPDGSSGVSSGGVFRDAACADAAMALFRVMGVTVLDGYGVSRLEFDDELLSSVMLASLSFERKAGDAVELPCSMIVCLEDKDIDHSVLSALTKRSIVFDGRVIVGTAYETSQPDVMAAGPVAMFSRRYGATESFETYSARDVGRDVAHVLLGRLGLEEFRRGGHDTHRSTLSETHPSTPDAKEDTLNGATATPNTTSSPSSSAASPQAADAAAAAAAHAPLPFYPSPVTRRVRMPCNYHYFSAVRGAAQFEPKDCIRLEYASTDMPAISLDDVPNTVTVSHGCGDDGEERALREMLIIFIHRRHRTVDGVVYFGNGTPPVHNYRALIGLPESLFHLEFRFNEALAKGGSSSSAGDSEEKSSASLDATTQRAGGGCGVLTAPIRNHRLDLVAYLRLPLFHPLLCEHFTTFFAQLRREVETVEEVNAERERVLREAQASGKLTPEDAAAQVAALTDTKTAFRYKVQLALLKYLHEGKDRRPQSMYLPGIERQVAMQRNAG
ncbi:hypothetical protein ABB37_00850 [Leptomonas pyrrhocoris]|uniref:Uncharacterized protein n=1 Tax=Leptomonas pyrrhocoris TaxID=157538 RepID=A0A0M9GBA6_LEPPY|nr:hypothetical protein ABB37_00850 [Leptomonas pyrrhocoris]KPA86783.1 hypothetical protein ABB37_00850 [Leptomonas pyrrhocoris]|eukprot:XP_015665222.1 hypothetical protein ABB37_00850 [Leptomonas pyrrhocoris]